SSTPLLPYTTLFRSVDALVVVSSGELRFSELVGENHRIHRRGRALVLQRAVVPTPTLAKTIPAGVDRERRCEHEVGLRQRFFRRSEEHTSELQSRFD